MIIVQINNKFVAPKDAKISIFSSAMRGYGIFETLRTFGDKQILQAKEHVERLFHSAQKIDLKIPAGKEKIRKMLEKVALKSPHKNQRLKIIVLEKEIIISSIPLKINRKIYKKGVSCKSISCTRSMPEVKSISYLQSFLSHESAAKDGYFDAILLDEKHQVTEGAYSNIFWFENDTLCTRNENILRGITRDGILKISPFKIKFKAIKIQELKQKSEVFLTSSIYGIVPITKIDQSKIGTTEPCINTQKLMELFKETFFASSAKTKPRQKPKRQSRSFQ